jgi:ribosome-associated translation inhibitor RaiA
LQGNLPNSAPALSDFSGIRTGGTPYWFSATENIKGGHAAMSTMQFQFNTDSSVMGKQEVATRIENQVRQKLARFEDRLTRLEVHVTDVNGRKHGADDKHCTIEARPRGGRPIGVTGKAADVDAAARIAAGTMAERLERVFGKAERHRHDPSPDKMM